MINEDINYAPLLNKYNLTYTENETWLKVGASSGKEAWILFISVITSEITPLLEVIVPVLISKKIPFRIVKNKSLHRSINNGSRGTQRVGKIIMLEPSSEQEATNLASIIIPLLSQFKGPRVNNSIRLGEVLYACYRTIVTINNGKNHVKLIVPKRRAIPFSIERNYHVREKKRFLLGKSYFLINKIRESPKGSIYKAISIRNLSFTPCIVKEGRLNMVYDFWGRSIRDRLLWQKDVHEDLYGKVPVAPILDFFEQEGDAYLVMEYIKGMPLEKKIGSYYKNKSWKDIVPAIKNDILNLYMNILCIAESIHEAGYIHRDIKHGNFLVLPSGKPFILDYEVSYSLLTNQPDPPFRMVAPAYQAPEQFGRSKPTIKEDIYSLGTLLVYFVTGIPPKRFFEPTWEGTKTKLKGLSIDTALIDIVSCCLFEEPTKRLEIREMVAFISAYMKWNISFHKTPAIAHGNNGNPIFPLNRYRSKK